MSRRFGTGLLLFGAMVAATGAVGGRFTAQGLGSWYDGLPKPSWTPPGSVIGMVWGVLYVLIAVASATVRAKAPARGFVALLVINLILNAGWCYVFFAARRPGAALAEIAVLELTCLGLVLLAARASSAAAWMLAPYAAWVAFAGILNASIVRLG